MAPRIGIPWFLLTLAVGGCGPATAPGAGEQWAADLRATNQVLFLNFRRSGDALQGTGILADLTGGGGNESLGLTGIRFADSVDIVLSRPLSGTYRLTGRYVLNGAGLAGTLDGGPYANLSVSFRRQ